MKVKKSIFMKSVLLAAMLMISLPVYSVPQGEILKFRPNRQHDTGLYAAPSRIKAPQKPAKVSIEGMPELIANSTSSKFGFGMYSFHPTSTLTPVKLADLPAFEGGCVYIDGKFYAANYQTDANGALTEVEWLVYDAISWKLDKRVSNPLSYTYIATDRTYDPVGKTIYSVSYDSTGQEIWLSTTRISDGKPTMIAKLAKDVIMIAADAQGNLYGLEINGNLYKIDKGTAALTLVGSAAPFADYSAPYPQSLAFDHRTGKLYWGEFHTEGLFTSFAALYEINPATGKSRKIADIPNAPELVGMYVADYTEADAPTRVSDLRAIPSETGSRQYHFSMKAPSLSNDGKSLSGNLSIKVLIDDEEMATLTAAPGASVTTGNITLGRGLHTVKATASNAKGAGETIALTFFAGYDVPAAVGNLSLTGTGNTVTLTWTAPNSGANGGEIRGPITYDVTRMNDNKVVARGTAQTRFTETITEPSYYTYKVTPISTEGRGTDAISNGMVIGTVNIPYSCSFDSETEFRMYTVVDLKSQGRVWQYDADNKRLRHGWSPDGEIDDYIYTPGLNLKEGQSYRISFDAYQMVGSYKEHVELYYGDSGDISRMTRVMDTGTLPEEAKNYSGVITPAKDGVYYVAFRSTQGKGGFMSYVDNVKIIETASVEDPAEITGFTATPAAKGEKKVTLTLTAPKESNGGTPLESIKEIRITRDGGKTPVKTFASPAPGAKLTWTDADVENGLHTYEAVAETAKGNSKPAVAKAFVGVDVPLMPSDVKASGDEGSRLISWKAPKSGANGGNLEGLVSYKVSRVVNDAPEVIAENVADTTYTDSWTNGGQAYVYYTVTAVTSAGESDAAASNGFTSGAAYKLPFKESFANGDAESAPWSVEQVTGDNGSWKISTSAENPYTAAQDGDKGVITFDGYHSWTKNCDLRLVSPSIDLSSYEDPELSFWMYHYDGMGGWMQEEPDPVNETLAVQISVEGNPFITLPEGEYTLYANKSGWKNYKLALKEYWQSKSVRIGFLGHATGCFNIHLDNITITGTKASGMKEALNDKAYVSGRNGCIIYSGLAGGISVYNMAGMKIAASGSESGSIPVAAGIYLIHNANKTYKIMVK